MIKSEDRRVDLASGAQGGPGEVIGIARFDDIGPDIIEQIEHQSRIQDEPVPGGIAREKSSLGERMYADGVAPRARSGLCCRDDQVMLVTRVLDHMEPFLRDVTLHSAADRRVNWVTSQIFTQPRIDDHRKGRELNFRHG